MTPSQLTPLELQILEALWKQGRLAIREIQESFPESERPAYSTVQVAVQRMEEKRVVRRVRKIGNAQIYDAAVSRADVRGRLLDEVLKFFGGRPRFVMAHMVEAGKLTVEEIREAEKLIEDMSKAKKQSKRGEGK